MTTNESLEIEWVKLEEGILKTPFITPDIGEELMKCKRFFLYYHCAYIPLQVWNDRISFLVHNPCTLYTSPIFEIPEAVNAYSNDGSLKVIASSDKIFINSSQPEYTELCIMIDDLQDRNTNVILWGGSIKVDAEIY